MLRLYGYKVMRLYGFEVLGLYVQTAEPYNRKTL